MWPPPHHQPNMTQPPLQRYPMPGKPQQHQMSAPDFRRPQAPIGQPQSAYFPGPPAQQMPSPGSIQRARVSILVVSLNCLFSIINHLFNPRHRMRLDNHVIQHINLKVIFRLERLNLQPQNLL
jgi:hypothetical protein